MIIKLKIIKTFIILGKLYKNDLTPLHYAALNNSKQMGEILISKGANINAYDLIYQILILLL